MYISTTYIQVNTSLSLTIEFNVLRKDSLMVSNVNKQ